MIFNRMTEKLILLNERLEREEKEIQDNIHQTQMKTVELEAINAEMKTVEEEFYRKMQELADARDYDGIKALIEKTKKESEALGEKISQLRF